MAGLQDFRAKYPQYNDMSDAALSDSLYKKYYSDMPRADFDAKMGAQPSHSSMGGIVKDIEGIPAEIARRFNEGVKGLGQDLTTPVDMGPTKAAQEFSQFDTGAIPSEDANSAALGTLVRPAVERANDTVGNAVSIPLSPLSGTLTQIPGQQVQEETKGRLLPQGVPAQLTGDILSAVVPTGAVGLAKLAKAAKVSRETSPLYKGAGLEGEMAKPPGPILDTGPEVEPESATNQRIQDAFFRVQQGGKADTAAADTYMRIIHEQNPEITPQVKQQLYTEIENKMVDPAKPLSPDAQMAWEKLKPLKDQETSLYGWLKENGYGDLLGNIDLSKPADESGYIHRIVLNRPRDFSPLDPAASDRDALTNSFRGQTLSKAPVSGLQSRTQFITQDADGKRVWLGNLPDGWAAGAKKQMSDGRYVTVKPATTAEIEANGSLRYSHDPFVNTMDNVLQLSRMKRNAQALDAIKTDMYDRDLLYNTGSNGASEAPAGFRSTTLPQFHGQVMPDNIAKAMDDFHGMLRRGDPGLQGLQKINNYLVGSMFMSPVPHMKNVLTNWIIERGADWATPPGWRSLIVDGARAIKSVATGDEDYQRMIREGSGIVPTGPAQRDFAKYALDQWSNDVSGDPQNWGGIAKNLGFKTPADMVRQVYNSSHDAMFSLGNILMMQRQYELMRQGMPLRAAIAESEKVLPNYRVPAQVAGSSGVSSILQNPLLSMFGRYRYSGIFKPYANAVKSMATGTPDQKMKTIGQLMAAGAVAYYGYPLLSKGVQAVTGNKDASVAPGGVLSPANAFSEYNDDGSRSWPATIGDIWEPSPVLTAANQTRTGKDDFGRSIAPAPGMMDSAAEWAKWGASRFSPIQMMFNASKQGGLEQDAGQLLGARIPPEGQKGRGRAAQIREQRSGARTAARDPILQAIHGALNRLGGQ